MRRIRLTPAPAGPARESATKDEALRDAPDHM
jgi:hypothetical protein